MTEEIINTCEYYKICESACGGTLEDTELCSCYQLYKQLKRLEFELKVTKADYEASEQENKELKEKYSHVLELAKTNADSNEYCLQELEKENEQLRSALEEIREIADKCKECSNEDDDCGCDYLRIKRRIEEVLGNENN